MNQYYLFDPNDISNLLKKYPEIKNYLGNIDKEGLPSQNIASARKSKRELFRIIANTHYKSLERILENLDMCLGSGWIQPKIMSTSSESEFQSVLSELYVATHYILNGFTVNGFDANKDNKPVPDLLITDEETNLICEVYSPIDWHGYEYYKEDLRLALKYLDYPIDYSFDLRIEVICEFKNFRLLSFDPWKFSKKYIKPSSRDTVILPLIGNIEQKIQDNINSTISTEYLDEETNTATKLILKSIQKSESIVPDRVGVIHTPTITGYSPEGMFKNFIEKRLQSKINRKQTDIDNYEKSIKIIFIDISKLVYDYEFEHPYYIENFASQLTDIQENGIDVIIFYAPTNDLQRGIDIKLLYVSKNVKFASVISILRINEEFDKYSEKVYTPKIAT